MWKKLAFYSENQQDVYQKPWNYLWCALYPGIENHFWIYLN